MDAVTWLDERCGCGRSSRVVPIPRRWDQVLGSGDVGLDGARHAV